MYARAHHGVNARIRSGRDASAGQRCVQLGAAVAEEAHARADAADLVEVELADDNTLLAAAEFGDLVAARVAHERAAVERHPALGADAIRGDHAGRIRDRMTDHHALP